MFFALPIMSFAAVSNPSGVFTKDMYAGMRTSDVSALQQCLKKDATLYPEGIISGYFGVLTEKAVQRFQIKNSIVSSGTPSMTGFGRTGPKTRGKLNEFCNTNPQSSLPTKSPSAPLSTPKPNSTSGQLPSTKIGTKKPSTPYTLSPEQRQGLLNVDKQDAHAPLGSKGPGGCDTEQQCEEYCSADAHYAECLSFIRVLMPQ